MENDLICINVPEATHRLVLLHGWGADADDLISIGQCLRESSSQAKFDLVALRAPHQHPEGFGRQWYGLFPPDWASVPSEIADLKNRIKELGKKSIGLEKTVIIGFSQGGAMALASGSELPLAGLISCSGYPHPNWSPPLKAPPVLLFHGIRDEVVPIDASRRLLEVFKNNKSQVELITFEGGHLIPQELFPQILLALQKWFV